jgi:uncharacterized protein
MTRPRRNTRPRDALGRPLPYGSVGVAGPAEGIVRSATESLAEAQRLLDAGRPFHAHEVLEDAWKTGPERERELWRGLAQLAVGITHAARGNATGARRLIERAADNVAAHRTVAPPGLRVDELLGWCRAAVETIDRGVPVDLDPPRLVPT